MTARLGEKPVASFLIRFLRCQRGTSTVETLAIVAGGVALAMSAMATVESGAVTVSETIETTMTD